MHSGVVLLVYVTLQRLVELIIAQRNTRGLVVRGAYEVGRNHYPVMVALHATWLAAMWLLGFRSDVVPAYLAVFVVLQLARFWVLATLGKRWTTRIIIVPGETPVTSGPYRFVRHPNYLVVAFEIPCVPLALGLAWVAILFGVANLAMLAWRIRCENGAYARLARQSA